MSGVLPTRFLYYPSSLVGVLRRAICLMEDALLPEEISLIEKHMFGQFSSNSSLPHISCTLRLVLPFKSDCFGLTRDNSRMGMRVF